MTAGFKFTNSFFVHKIFAESFIRSIELSSASTPGEDIYDKKIQ